MRHGTGEMLFSKGDVYVGQWIDDQMCGLGHYTYVSSSCLHNTL